VALSETASLNWLIIFTV
jgi:hypothetical protein